MRSLADFNKRKCCSLSLGVMCQHFASRCPPGLAQGPAPAGEGVQQAGQPRRPFPPLFPSCPTPLRKWIFAACHCASLRSLAASAPRGASRPCAFSNHYRTWGGAPVSVWAGRGGLLPDLKGGHTMVLNGRTRSGSECYLSAERTGVRGCARSLPRSQIRAPQIPVDSVIDFIMTPSAASLP